MILAAKIGWPALHFPPKALASSRGRPILAGELL